MLLSDDYRPLHNGEKIKDGDVFVYQNKVFPATDIGNGIMSDNHFPHYRLRCSSCLRPLDICDCGDEDRF